MGYTFTIGEMKDGHVALLYLEQAPSLPGSGQNDRTNKRQPSYRDWATFCDTVGLRSLFYDDLIVCRPGIVPLTLDHVQQVMDARERYQRTHPHAQARHDTSVEDEQLARLVWLEWWFRWSLANCRCPGIENR